MPPWWFTMIKDDSLRYCLSKKATFYLDNMMMS